MNKEKLTVFVITYKDEPNFNQCISALKSQTIDFKLEVISDIAPMSSAFQEMLNRCTTPFFIQCDSDMILENRSVEKMYRKILGTEPKTAMVCFRLFDCHLNKRIDGIKIYKHDIFKNFPYKNILGCEMEQLKDLEIAGYHYIRVNEVMGNHSPIWTHQNIFERYFNYIEKYKKVNSPNQIELLKNLFNIYQKSNSTTDLYAFLGGLLSYISKEFRQDEKDFLNPILNKYSFLKDIIPNEQKELIPIKVTKPLILQVAGIPCAGRPYETNNLINQYSSLYRSRHILGCQYGKNTADIPYREFPYDLIVSKDIDQIKGLFEEASIIHIHHKLPVQLKGFLKPHHKVIYTVSNIGSSTLINNCQENQNFYDQITKISDLITVTDQPIQKQLYANLTTTTIPLVKLLQKEPRPENPRPLVVFAPTNKRQDNTTSKGYYRVLNILYKLKLENYDFDFDLIEGVDYLSNIERKRKADILIDDVVNENFHNSAIESALLGSVPLTNYSDENYPFLKTSLVDLEQTLIKLITDPLFLNNEKERMKKWATEFYTPEFLVSEYERLYDSVLDVKEKEIIVGDNLSIFNDIVKIFEKNNIEFCLGLKTCLQCVLKKPLKNPFYVECKSLNDKTLTDLNQKGYIYNNNIIIYNDFRLDIGRKYPNKVKLLKGLDLKQYPVPFPVETYLMKKFGNNWKKQNV